MDLTVFTRVVWRFRIVMILGLLLALALATLAYFKVRIVDGSPKLSPRATQIWQADSTILLSQHGFPAGNVNGINSVGRLIGLGPLYAKLANSDAVQELMRRNGGALDGSYQAIPAADTTYGAVSDLPGLTIIGKSDSAANALRITRRASTEFISYLHDEQDQAAIPERQRVDAQLLNAAGDLKLIVPRKKTVSLVVFFGVMFATLALVFVLENARRGEPLPVRSPESYPVKDLEQSA